MVSALVSLFMGLFIPIVSIGINKNTEKQEKISCYSILAICVLIYITIWGRDGSGINWFLLIFIAILVLLNIKSPDILKGALSTLVNIVPTYLEELRKAELTSSEEASVTMTKLLSTLVKINIGLIIFSFTPFFGQKQAFCVIIGTVIYIFVVHYFLVRSEHLEIALKKLFNTIRNKLHLISSDYDENKEPETDDGDADEEDYPPKRKTPARETRSVSLNKTDELDDLDEIDEDFMEQKPVRQRGNQLKEKVAQSAMVDNILHEDILPTMPSNSKNEQGSDLSTLLGLDNDEDMQTDEEGAGLDEFSDIDIDFANVISPNLNIAPPLRPNIGNTVQPTRVTPITLSNNNK